MLFVSFLVTLAVFGFSGTLNEQSAEMSGVIEQLGAKQENLDAIARTLGEGQ